MNDDGKPLVFVMARGEATPRWSKLGLSLKETRVAISATENIISITILYTLHSSCYQLGPRMYETVYNKNV